MEALREGQPLNAAQALHRFNQRHKGPMMVLHILVLKDTSRRRVRIRRRRYRRILMRSTKAHLHSVTFVISIQMEEENHICDANSAGVLVNVLLCIPHTRLIRAGSSADSNLALCDPQIRDREEEVCALECVCLDVAGGDFHFSIRGDNGGV